MVKVNLGEIGEGFRLAESRWALNDFPSSKRNFRQPIWLGPHRSPDSALLLYLEQGLGDELMLTWYLPLVRRDVRRLVRSEEHTSELQSLMRISYAVFCLKKKIKNEAKINTTIERIDIQRADI